MENILLIKKRGFTLLEVLIVIAIIGILVSLGTVSYSSAQAKSRDSRRRGDLKAIQNAWEQYYADNNGAYPAACSVGVAYLPGGIPVDPKDNTAYPGVCTASSYCFCHILESGVANANSACNYMAASKTHFCVSQLQ